MQTDPICTKELHSEQQNTSKWNVLKRINVSVGQDFCKVISKCHVFRALLKLRLPSITISYLKKKITDVLSSYSVSLINQRGSGGLVLKCQTLVQ